MHARTMQVHTHAHIPPHSLSNVGIEDHQSVLVHLENGQLGEGTDAIWKGLNEVLREVKVRQVREARQTLWHIFKPVLTHIQAKEVLKPTSLRGKVGYLVVVQPELL